jgi:flagellar basal-body rod protein FlgG
MWRSLATAAAGMQAQQTRLDVTANNIANVSTSGFKKSRAEFADLMYQTMRPAGAPTGTGTTAPGALEVGLGVRVAGTQRLESQGALLQTENALDVAIQGKGYFEVTLPSGETAYTRNGSFKKDAEGQLVTSEGYVVGGGITVPAEATAISIGADGQVAASVPGDPQPQQLGQLQLATFINPAGLEAKGNNLFTASAASGEAITVPPGTDGAGSLQQGFLEGSNVNVVTEMIDLIAGQRAYEVNTRVIKAADEMLGQTAALR